LPELKSALGTTTNLTVFRKLKLLDYLSSYTHRGRYYALRETARFDEVGLWSHDAVWFSRYGTLVATIEALVNQAPRGLRRSAWSCTVIAPNLRFAILLPSHGQRVVASARRKFPVMKISCSVVLGV
jgi:hypothetical protein